MQIIPTISREYKSAGTKKLDLSTFSGDVEIIGHQEESIKIEVFVTIRGIYTLFIVKDYLATVNRDVLDFDITQVGETLTVHSKPNYWHPYNWIHFMKTSFRIYVPMSFDTEVITYSGDILIKNLNGNHRFKTWGGDIALSEIEGKVVGITMGGAVEINKCKAEIESKTWGGNIRLNQNQGNFKTNTSGGRIDISNHQGKIEAKTWGGNIYLNRNQGDMNISTAGGKIIIDHHEGNLKAKSWGGSLHVSEFVGDFECTTAGGSITLFRMDGNIGASTKGGKIKLHANSIKEFIWLDTAGGNIHATLPFAYPMNLDASGSRVVAKDLRYFEGYKSRGVISGKINGGGAVVRIHTSGGTIRLFDSEQSITKEKVSETPVNQGIVNDAAPKPNPEKPKENVFYDTHKTPQKPSKEAFVGNSNNIFFTLLFCLVATYGFSSVLFFTLEAIDPKSILKEIYKGIFYSNVANGLACFLAIYTFIYWLEHRIRTEWIKYVIVSALTLFYATILQVAVGILYWRHIDTTRFKDDQNNDNNLYILLPMLVSCIYLWYWQRNRRMNRKISEQEYQLLNLEKLKSKAQLDALEARINPHFLYNSLNSITELIHADPDKAEEMTIQLSKLFRYTTGRNEANFHAISEELEIIKSYLAIEQIRFGNRLTYQINCEESIKNQQISRFLLQPLVENAIKHGISKISQDGKIEVSILQIDNFIHIKIHDNGPAFDESLGSGFGLRGIREKLRIVYGQKATFELQNQPQKAVLISYPS